MALKKLITAAALAGVAGALMSNRQRRQRLSGGSSGGTSRGSTSYDTASGTGAAVRTDDLLAPGATERPRSSLE